MTMILVALIAAALTALVALGFRVVQIGRERAALERRAAELEIKAVRLESELSLTQAQHRQLHDQLETEFENFTRRQLDESHLRLEKWSKDSLGALLTPVHSELETLQRKIHEVYDREARERLSLKNEIELMMKAQGQLSLEAQSLVKALRGDVRVQGTWGEIILERILEASGLREGEEFIVQGRGLVLKGDDGGTRKPDVLVRLPGGRHVIIDSKVSLTAYEAMARAENESERARRVDEFLVSVRRHVEELAARDYQHLYGINSPDFVLMFVPTEGAFAAAHQADPELFNFALKRKVAIVSPALLFPNLRTVEAIWRQDRQNRNAEEIARQAGSLYDKFAGLVDDLATLETHLSRAQETRLSIQAKLRDGRGNLLDRVEKLRQLGAKTKRQLEVGPAEVDNDA